MTSAVVILHYGDKSTTKKALKDLKKKIKDNILIIVNNTAQDISEFTKIIKNTQIIDNKSNLGFAKAVNQGITLALTNKSVDSALLLNNDLSISFGSIDMLRKTLFTSKNAGIVSPVLHHSDNIYDWGGKFNKWIANAKHQNFEQKPKRVIEVDHVAGAAMLIKKDLLDKIGMFDETFFLYFEDLDFCLRAKEAGYRILIDPEVVAEHEISKSSKVFKRTIYQWQSHIKFTAKYMFRGAYPTAIFYDVIFYPLVILKLLLTGNFK